MSQTEHSWYYISDGLLGTTQTIGPIPQSELMSLARDGKIKRETLACSPTRTNGGWLAASQMPGLLRAIEVGEEERRLQQERDAQERIAKQEAAAAERKARELVRAAERKTREDERAKQRALATIQQSESARPKEIPVVVLPPTHMAAAPADYPPQYAPPPFVSVHVEQPSQAAHSLGIGSIVLGVVSFFVCWIPLIGLFLGGLGLLLGIIGTTLAISRKGTGVGYSIAGAALSSIAVMIGAFYLLSILGAARIAVPSGARGSSPSTTANASPEAVVKRKYIQDSIRLYDCEAKYFKTYLDDRVAGVLFKLRNMGDRQLDKVEVTVYFKDASGAVVFEENFHPVLVTKYSFGDNKPLKPGYVWQVENGKFYTVESVPSEWEEGAAEFKITDIEFSESPAP